MNHYHLVYKVDISIQSSLSSFLVFNLTQGFSSLTHFKVFEL